MWKGLGNVRQTATLFIRSWSETSSTRVLWRASQDSQYYKTVWLQISKIIKFYANQSSWISLPVENILRQK